MKTVLTKFIAVSSIPLLMLTACKKNDPIVKTNGGTAGTLSSNTQNLVLQKASFTDTTKVIKFTFTKPEFGFSAAVNNTLQIDSMGDNWKKPQSYTLPAKTYSQGFSTADFNTLLLKMNLAAGLSNKIQVRVQHALSASSYVYSNVLTLDVTPFNLISYLWVPGTYQNSDPNKQWIPPAADSLVSPTDNGVYTGYVYFDAGGIFKVTTAKDWNHTNYGDGGGGGKISSSGGNLNSPGAGLYFVTVDLNANTIKYQAYQHTWSLIGDADVDWSTDFQMPFVQNDNAYEVVTTLKSTGGFKFRADNDWAISYGNPTPITGQLTSSNGGNLTAPAAGKYLVKFTFGNPLLAPSYSLTPAP
jgi:hypothetical protein